MRKIKRYLFLIVFIFFFISGINVGGIIAQGQKEYRAQENLSPSIQLSNNFTSFEAPVKTNDQNTLLVALVDSLSGSHAQLEGAWLIIWTGQSKKITLMPLYPVAGAPQLITYLSPHSPLVIPSRNMAYLEQLDVIKHQKVEWDDTIIIDEKGLTLFIQISGNQDIENENISQISLRDQPKVWDNPQGALSYQEGLLQYLCMHSQPFSRIVNFQGIMELMDNQIYTSLSPVEITNQWETIKDKEFQIECEFPYQEE